ncbi:MAG: geranylgeranyl reductase family protein [Thermoanaerobacterales bacterium]|nr:geranylgeranyl reductase family protein [Thermoanaerobacterales bacterium]
MEGHQVIIVGGGPGGSFLAYLLAREGLDVILLERRPMPRRKPCGGGITAKTAVLLSSLPWQTAVEDVTRQAAVYYHRRTVVSWEQPVCHMVRREKFDHLLLTAAREAGARTLEGCTVTAVAGDDRGVTVYTATHGALQAELAIGADGAQSVVARDIRRGTRQGMALVAEVLAPPDRLADLRGDLVIDLAAIPAGYGWVFPKDDHLNVGLGTFSAAQRDLPALLDAFLERMRLKGTPVRHRQGFPLPFHYLADPSVTGVRTMLIGDAAGLCDPFTGEGIYHSCLSAATAAEAVLARRARLWEAPALYQRLLDRRLRREMALAHRLARAFYGMTGWAAGFLERRPDLMQEFWTYLYTDTYAALWRTLFRRLRRHFLHV